MPLRIQERFLSLKGDLNRVACHCANWSFIALLALALISMGRSASAQTFSPPPAPPTPVPSVSPAAAPSAFAATPSSAPSASPVPSPALPPAGVVPASLSLDITGSPQADPGFLDEQVHAALDRLIRPTLAPGASIAYGTVVPWPLAPLPSGARTALNVAVTISGSDTSATVTGVTTVTLNSIVLAQPAPPVLFLSDDPEYLQSDGLIFSGRVTAQRAARLYYYHSDVGVPRDLDVVLTAAAPSQVALIESSAGPELDVMTVGHAVTRDFLEYTQGDEGIIINVQPGKPFIVRHALLLAGEVAAGAVDVHVISGGAVTVAVVGSPAGSAPQAYLNGPRMPSDGHRRHGTFDLLGFGNIQASYTAGGPATAVQYGGKMSTPRNLDPSDGGLDYGDYGVIHHITFTLANPTDAPTLAYLYEKPLAGPVSSNFVINGQFKDLGCVRMPQPYWLQTFELPAHSTGTSTTVTMTDGGSFYPLEFGVTDTQPVPNPPAVGSADGCSPTQTSARQPTAQHNRPAAAKVQLNASVQR